MTMRKLFICNMAWNETTVITVITQPDNNGGFVYENMTVRKAVDYYGDKTVLWFDTDQVRIDT